MKHGYIANSRRFGSRVDDYPQHLTIEDTLDNLGRAILGLTINCARCHDQISYAWGFGTRGQTSGGGTQTVMIAGGGGGGGMAAGFGAGAADKRFRVELYLSAQNLLNRANYVGYSGVITSPFFGQPTNVMNPRKLQMGVRFGF